MKKVKQIICIIIAALILVTAPVTSYMDAQATEVVVTAGVLENLLGLFGVSVGLGNQQDFWSQANMDYIYDGISNGDVISMGSYGDVDFSDSQSVYNWLNTMAAVDGFLVGSGNIGLGEEVAKTIKNNCVKMDMVSYHNTGTTATGAMNDYITELRDEFQTAPEQSLKELQEYIRMMYVIGSMASPNGDDDDEDDDEKAARKKKMWRNFCAVASAALLGGTSAALPLAALKEASETEYSEYDAAFEDGNYFDGTYQTDADGNYVYYFGSSSEKFLVNNKPVPQIIDCTFRYKVCGYLNGNNVSFLQKKGDIVCGIILPLAESGQLVAFVSYTNYFGNIPLYSSQDAARAALEADDFSDAENIQDNPYKDYKSNASTAGAVLGSALAGLISSLSSLSALADICPGLYDVSDSKSGTSDALTSVEEYLSGATPSPDPEPDPVPGTDYSGLLGKILTAIKSIVTAINNLPLKLVTAFANKFMTAQGLSKLINGLPDAFVEAFKVMLTGIFPNSIAVADSILGLDDIIVIDLPEAIATKLGLPELLNGLPDAFVEVFKVMLTGIFPKSIDVADAVLDLDDIIVIDLPEAIATKLGLSELLDGLPDAFVEVFKVMLTGIFPKSIDVADKVLDLDNIILNAVKLALEGALIPLFEPDPDVTKLKLGEMREYFEFKDDIIGAFDDLKIMIFGITPSPILKIPVGAETSKYNYGIGSYIIIDVSWYSTYKQYGDKVILAICWAFFIWRLYLKLPGIISGGEGSIVAADKSYNRYINSKDD